MKNHQQMTGIKSAANALNAAAAALTAAIYTADQPKATTDADIQAAADILHAALAALTAASSATQMAQMHYDHIVKSTYEPGRMVRMEKEPIRGSVNPPPIQPPVSQGVHVSVIGQQKNNAPDFVRRAIANSAAKSDETAFDRQGQRIRMVDNVTDALNQMGEDTSGYRQAESEKNEPVIQGYQEWKPRNRSGLIDQFKKKKKF